MNMGSLNFNISGAAARIKEFREDWEKPYLEMTKDFILSNTFTQIERGTHRALCQRHPVRVRVLRPSGTSTTSPTSSTADWSSRRFFVQGVFGILGGIAAEFEHLGPHAGHRGPAARRGLLPVVPWCRPAPDVVRHAERDEGRPRAGRARGLDLHLQGRPGGVERRSSGEDRAHLGRAVARGRDPRTRRGRCWGSRVPTASDSEPRATAASRPADRRCGAPASRRGSRGRTCRPPSR